MVDAGVDGIEFVSVNTDGQALLTSKAPLAVRIGDKLTKGLGAGGRPEVGQRAAEESSEGIAQIVKGADMVFITAGMGGGTGTGASPVIAALAKQAGALTVGVVTRPFEFEGNRRSRSADDGVNALRENVDALITIPNERLLTVVDPKTSVEEAFQIADEVLHQGIAGISDLITKPGMINLVPVTKKEYKGAAPWVMISNFHVKIDGCVGESFIRSYAILTKSTDQGDAILSWYGVTKAV